jgi:CubicO group peptidase (beta-lactamase class C family)
MALSPALAQRVDAVFSDLDPERDPGGALLVIDRGERLCTRCYGLADVEAGRPITTDTAFYLASMAKPFTAMAVMMLAEQGKLGFDDRLPAYFPRFPAWGTEITLRHLLHHTAGLPAYFSFCTTEEMIGLTNELVAERLMGVAGPDFPVGTQYVYTDTAYVLLAMIVAIVSGRSFAEFLNAHVFAPLGMRHTVVYDASRPARHKLAQGYLKQDGRFERWDYPLLTTGDGGLFSTIDDLFLWDQALNGERLVAKATLERAFASGTTNDGIPVDYGFGWYTNAFPGGRHVAHGGMLAAYNNYIVRFPDTARTIIILTNHGPIERVYHPAGVRGPRIRAIQVAEILFGD